MDVVLYDAAHTGSAGTTDHQAELDTLLDILLATELHLGIRARN